MAELISSVGIKLLITDITNFDSLIQSCHYLAMNLNNKYLESIAQRYQLVIDSKSKMSKIKFLSAVLLIGDLAILNNIDDFEYVIWKNPFMVIGQSTFISANFDLIGIKFNHQEKYPEISDEQLKKSGCFFSSEPFPFSNKFQELSQLGYRGIVVDGEKISWFGIRNLIFLESVLK